MDYQEYLQSDTWRTLRAHRLKADNHECVLCGKTAEQVHHRRYPKELGTESIQDLISLCGRCHTKHHNKEIKCHTKRLSKDSQQEMEQKREDMKKMLLDSLTAEEKEQIA